MNLETPHIMSVINLKWHKQLSVVLVHILWNSSIFDWTSKHPCWSKLDFNWKLTTQFQGYLKLALTVLSTELVFLFLPNRTLVTFPTSR